MKLQKNVSNKNTLIVNGNYDFIKNNLLKFKNKISNTGSIFILFKNQYYSNNDVKNDFLDVIDFCLKEKLFYINTIVCPTNLFSNASNHDNVLYVLWFSKNQNNYIFNKDKIREKSIWQNVEWGRRTKNYNAKGKDPGNVWIPTLDDGNGHITKHSLLSEHEIIQRIIKMSCINDNDYIYKKQNIKLRLNHKISQKINFGLPTIQQKIKNAKVFFASSEKMNFIKNNSISCIVTSPPYWDLKDYLKKGQIGQEAYSKYLDRLKTVWSECYKKLKKDGFLWININIRKKQKTPILMPLEIKRQCQKIGFHFKGIAIWHKSSGIPVNKTNLKDNHEYVLIFTKCTNNQLNFDGFKHIHDYKNDAINFGLFWNINRKAGSVGKQYIHPAIYPTELPARCILLSTKPNDFVLDPFLGSGTTLIASVNLNRQAVGVEYNTLFKQTISYRVKKEINKCKIKFLNLLK